MAPCPGRPFADDGAPPEQGGLRGLAGGGGAGRTVRSLAEVIAFNRRHAREELSLFGQEPR